MYLSGYCSHNAGSRDGFPKGNSKGSSNDAFLTVSTSGTVYHVLAIVMKIFDFQITFLLVQVSSQILYLHLYSYYISWCVFTIYAAQNFSALHLE